MKMRLKRADSLLLFVLSALIPAFYLFLKTNKFASLNIDSNRLLRDALILFLFLIGVFFNHIVKIKALSFVILLFLSAASFWLLPESALLFSAIVFLFWSISLLKGNEAKSLYALAFYSQSLFLAFGLYIFKIQFFVSLIENGRDDIFTFILIFSLISLVFVPLYFILYAFEKKKSFKKTVPSKKRRQSSGFKADLLYYTEALLVFLTNLFFVLSHHLSEDLLRFSLFAWIAAAVVLFFELNPRSKTVSKHKQSIL